MIKVNILGNKYNLPTEPKEISFGDYVSINSYLSELKTINHSNRIDILSLITNCPQEDLELIDDNQINILYNSIAYLHHKIKFDKFERIFIEGQRWGIADLEKLSVKEYCDIDFYIRDGKTVYDNLDKVLAICLRPEVKNISFNNILLNVIEHITKIKCLKVKSSKELKPFDESKLTLYEDMIFNNFNAEIAMTMLELILEYRIKMTKNYSLVFVSNEVEDEYEEVSLVKSVTEIWGFYNTIASICENDKQKIDYWMNKPIKELFTHLSYLKQLSLENQNKH